MRIDEITDTDPALGALLMKLHKGATGGFNAKSTQAILGLFPGWTMTKETFLKPSDLAWRGGFRDLTSVPFERWSEPFQRMMQDSYSLNATASRPDVRLHVRSNSQEEADALYDNVKKYVVTTLPDPKKTKADQYFVMNLTEPKPQEDKNGETEWVWSFDLLRKCQGYRITAPDGQHFDECGPVKVLGYTGTKDFAMFFKWALENTDLEASINAKLGLKKHLKASERPRVPVGGQTIGTCAICLNAQVVRNGGMVLHGYQRPGHGYVVGNCFGTNEHPYEVSANACVAYIPVLEGYKTGYQQKLANLKGGKVTQFVEKKRNYRTGRDEQVITKKGDPNFDHMLASHISETERQITYIDRDIAEMNRRIKDWKPGTLRRNEGLPGVTE